MIVLDEDTVQQALEKTISQLSYIDLAFDDIGRRSRASGGNVKTVSRLLTGYINQVLKEKGV